MTNIEHMTNIDRLIRSLRAWRRHRPDWTLALNRIEARLQQQLLRAGSRWEGTKPVAGSMGGSGPHGQDLYGFEPEI